MRWLVLSSGGSPMGDFAAPQDITQPAYAGCTQVEVEDNDSRLVSAAPYVPPTPREWLERLSAATQLAIHAAALKDTTGQTLLWINRAAGSPSIDVTAQETIDGVGALVTAGVLTTADQTTLLAK